jgi:hypothetical protein
MIWLIIFFAVGLMFGHKLRQAGKEINKVLGNIGFDIETEKDFLKKIK